MRIIFIILLAIFLVGCSQPLVAETIPLVPETVVATQVVTKTVENTDKIEQLQTEVQQYQNLINSLNQLLKNVYYVYQKKSDGSWTGGTGFSIEYDNRFYFITAGHVVENEFGTFKNLGFKANFSNKYIYPKLLTYKTDYNNRNDYAVFITNKITNRFVVDEENDSPEHILGYNNINIIKNINGTNIEGESGSPIIDNEGEIVGILSTDIFNYYTNIDTVLQAIK